MADYTSLRQQAQAIRNEVKIGANTANRVGVALEGIISAVEMENQRATEAESGLNTAKQKKLNRLTESQQNTVIESAITEQGLKSSLYLQPEQAALVHYNNPDNVAEGTGVFANDDGIYLYTDVSKGKTPFYIKKSGSDSGEIVIRDKNGSKVSDDLAEYLQDINRRLAILESYLTQKTEEQ